MKLYKRPGYKAEEIEVTTAFGGRYRAMGQQTCSDVQIMVEDTLLGDDQLDDTFRTLKYGPMPDLAEAMHYGQKINKIVFEKDNIILHGVTPTKMERSATFNGRLFTCTIDTFEVIDE